MEITVKKSEPLKGVIEIPADKSITHRAFLFSMLTKGRCRIKNFSKGKDCMSSLNAVQQLGCTVEYINENELIIDAPKILKKPDRAVDCGNSGTAARIISGILAGQNFNTVLTGDESLSKRPMKRIIEPLELMGAEIVHNDFKLPLEIKGLQGASRLLKGIDYVSPLASAQVKSCILAAGLFADGAVSFTEPYQSRNHTELMFKYMGADINVCGNKVSIKKSSLNPADITICGDISSAAFFITAALLVPGSDILIKNTGINETRNGIIEIYKKMNADIEILNERIVSNEKTADIRVRYSNLKSAEIKGALIPRLIDEIPVIALAASQAEGETVIKDAADLRNKESDRIKTIAFELNKLGADITETPDGLVIRGKTPIKGGCVSECCHDHRIAMTEYIAGLISINPVSIKEFQWTDISFPEFLTLFAKLSRGCRS